MINILLIFLLFDMFVPIKTPPKSLYQLFSDNKYDGKENITNQCSSNTSIFIDNNMLYPNHITGRTVKIVV